MIIIITTKFNKRTKYKYSTTFNNGRARRIDKQKKLVFPIPP